MSKFEKPGTTPERVLFIDLRVFIPANKKRFQNVLLWLYEGLVELNVVGT